MRRRIKLSPSLLVALYGSLLGFAGCSFGDDEEASTDFNQNSCSADADCGKQQQCQAGRCVAFAADKPRSVTLMVTPKSMPDGSEPQTIVSEPFPLTADTNRTFGLPLPLSIPVRIHSGSTPIAAQVTFTPVATAANVSTAKSTTVTTVALTNRDDDDGVRAQPTSNATLVPDRTYAVVVQPSDPVLSAYTLTFTAVSGATLDVDYAETEWHQRSFRVRNVPCGTYSVRARKKGGGPLLSNTVAIPTLSARVTLKFDPASTEAPYDLELVPNKGTASAGLLADLVCSPLSPAPTISVPSQSLKADGADSQSWTFDFPTLPDPIEYTGQIALCENQVFSDNLPVTVKGTAIALPGAASSSNTSTAGAAITGTYETTSTATSIGASTYTFSTLVFPGDYTFVITPPANLNCEIFAERRAIKAPSDTDASAEPDTLTLKAPATLSGRVLSPDMTPIANASIDLVALGTSSVTLAENDRTVPLYNRSRQGTTAATGMFNLPVDIGSYDLVVKPPARTNYAWRILYGIDVGSRTPTFTTLVYLTAPVVVSGKLGYVGGGARDQSSLASAEVRAYTVIDEATGERSVEIARGQADANGNLTLLLPPQLQKSWIPE